MTRLMRQAKLVAIKLHRLWLTVPRQAIADMVGRSLSPYLHREQHRYENDGVSQF